MIKQCKFCGIDFEVPKWRFDKAIFCSRQCRNIDSRAKANCTCAICGKSFHRKPYHLKRYKGNLGYCCSRKCNVINMQRRMSGKGNHQYGLRGEKNASFKKGNLMSKNNKLVEEMVWVGEWYKKPNTNGRITIHRYLVESNHHLFNPIYFDAIDGWFYLKENLVVHHIDFNHGNNHLENLQILTLQEHTRLHNLATPRPRNEKGQFIKKIV